MEVTAYQVDARLHEELRRTLKACAELVPSLSFEIVPGDFIEEAAAASSVRRPGLYACDPQSALQEILATLNTGFSFGE